MWLVVYFTLCVKLCQSTILDNLPWNLFQFIIPVLRIRTRGSANLKVISLRQSDISWKMNQSSELRSLIVDLYFECLHGEEAAAERNNKSTVSSPGNHPQGRRKQSDNIVAVRRFIK